MTTPVSAPFAWSVETIATWGSYAVLLLAIWFLTIIYSRAGSLFFLRDLIWRSFGGKHHFESPSLEQMRKQLRELEHFRYEFNIPANSLEDAERAQQWITAHQFPPSDIGRSRHYIDWADFTALKFKTQRFTRKKFIALYVLLGVILSGWAITPPFADTNYLVVSLKNAPDAPSFFVSTEDIKFDFLFPKHYLTVEQCRSSESLKPFIREGLPEERLDIICSFVIDPGYVNHVEKGLREQRMIVAVFLILCMAGMCLIVLKLSRMDRARKLHRHWETCNQP